MPCQCHYTEKSATYSVFFRLKLFVSINNSGLLGHIQLVQLCPRQYFLCHSRTKEVAKLGEAVTCAHLGKWLEGSTCDTLNCSDAIWEVVLCYERSAILWTLCRQGVSRRPGTKRRLFDLFPCPEKFLSFNKKALLLSYYFFSCSNGL